MAEKNLETALLLDFYGEMLTAKQREAIDYYYNDDLSLAEIAEHEGITRQGVRDNIKRGEASLSEMENKLGLVQRFRSMRQTIARISDDAAKIAELNERYCISTEIGDLADKINKRAQKLMTD
jgi:predicted DNA-binding protein YlxM (UPF0122 family)